MNYPLFFDSKNSFNLFGLKDKFDFLTSLYKSQKLPKVLLLSGHKGSGKSTLINHFLMSVFDEKKYDSKNCIISKDSSLYNQYKKDIFSNIIYIKGSDYRTVKVDDIRNLKTKFFQSTILNKNRFIVLDDVELFNTNSLNALLKIIEEPTKNNYFFLINNKSRPLLDTIKSRSLEIKIILNEINRLEIISNLIKFLEIETVLDAKKSGLTPGNFIKFNYIFNEHGVSFKNDFIENITLLLSLYKKSKDILLINIAFFLTDYYFNGLLNEKKISIERFNEIKNFIFNNLNNFLLYNINQNTLINAVNNKLKNE